MTGSATTPGEAEDGVTFVRLTEIRLADVLSLLNNRRTHRHLPLAGEFTAEAAGDWVRAKDAQWDHHGYGPWAILVDGRFAGWGGFQREEGGADFALVLEPRHWGRGEEITRKAFALGFGELELEEVTIALPYSRDPGRVLAPLGFVPAGEATYGGVTFRQYRLSRSDWLATGSRPG